MALLANVSLTNTFDTWRTRTNQLVTRINQFAINESSLYANTLTSNTAFTAKGTATVTGLFTASGRATVGTNLTVSGNTTIGAASKTITTTGAWSHTGWGSFTTNLTVSGNTTLGATGKTITSTGTLNHTGNTYVSGRLGVGTSSPSVKIHSTSVSSGDGIMSEYTGSGQYAAASMILRTNVGTTNQRQVHLYNYVQDASNLYGNFAIGQFNGAGSYIQTLAQYDMNGNIWSFNTAGAERLRIAASGEVIACNSLTVTKNLTVSGNTTLNGTTTDKSNALSQTLTDGATINWDVALGRVATVTLGAAGRTMAAPTNLKVGTYILRVYQDATGSRTITTWNSVFKWTAAVAPVLSTGANKLDIITFFSDGTNLYGSYLPDMR